MCEIYNKTIIKIAGLSFASDSVALTKIRTQLYNHLKIDLKHFIEYEYEFDF